MRPAYEVNEIQIKEIFINQQLTPGILSLKTPKYNLLLFILLNVCSLVLPAGTVASAESQDSIRQRIRSHSYLLLHSTALRSDLTDSLLQEQIPLAILVSAGEEEPVKKLIRRFPEKNRPVLVISGDEATGSVEHSPGIVALTEGELDKVQLSEDLTIAQQRLGCREFLWITADTDSLVSIDLFVRFWERTGKLPNFIQAGGTNVREVSGIVTALNRQPKLFGVVRNGDQLLADVSWKDFSDRKTNGYFSFPLRSDSRFALSPYKAGYQFSPDIILPTPENIGNIKTFNAVPLDSDFGLTDRFLFSQKARNLQRENDDEMIVYGLGFVADRERGKCAFFSGKDYLDGGLMSRSALKANFSITAWIKPTELEANNCILGKGKDFVLKIHNGLLTFTVQGIKDYFSVQTRIPVNQWSFISLVHTGSGNQISFYLNGERTEQLNLLTPYLASDYTLLIGSNLWEEFFVGYMSELNIWDRELNPDEIRQEYASGKDLKRSSLAGVVVWIILFFGVLGYVLRRRLLHQKPAGPVPVPVSGKKLIPAAESSSLQEQISCFGGLQVIGAEGKEVSLKFSPRIKQLFVLIFLHSVAGRKGISSKKITDCLWPGMNVLNAKNSRGTNIQNLKALLAPCGGIKLVFRDKHWLFEFGADYFIDYDFVETKLNELAVHADIGKLEQELPGLLPVLKKGTLFPNMSESWVDPYIDRMSNRIIEFGLNVFGTLSAEKYDSLLLGVAEVISINDPLNETALRKKINILTRQGKLSLAHSVFDAFTKLYQELYQEKYAGDFKSMLTF